MVYYLPVTVQLIPVIFHPRLLLTGNVKYFYKRVYDDGKERASVLTNQQTKNSNSKDKETKGVSI